MLFLARLLGVKEYGLFAGAFALITTMTPYSALGAGMLFMRYVSADKTRQQEYWGNVFISTTAGTAALCVVLYFLGGFLIGSDARILLIILAVANFFCSQIVSCAGAVFQTFEKFRVSAVLNLLTNLSRFFAVGIMYVFQHRATALQWSVGLASASGVAAIIGIVWVSCEVGRPVFNLRLACKRAAEGFGFSFAGSTQSVYNDIDKTLLSHFGMNAQSGIYTLAYRIVDFATAPVNAVDSAALPRYFYLNQKSFREVTKLCRRLIYVIIPLGAGMAGLTVVMAPLLPRLVGRDFGEILSALRWLCLLPVLRGVHQIVGSALTGSGYQPYRTAAQCGAAILNVTLNILLIPSHGWLGAAWATLATDGSLGVINIGLLMFVRRKEESVRRQSEPVVKDYV